MSPWEISFHLVTSLCHPPCHPPLVMKHLGHFPYRRDISWQRWSSLWFTARYCLSNVGPHASSLSYYISIIPVILTTLISSQEAHTLLLCRVFLDYCRLMKFLSHLGYLFLAIINHKAEFIETKYHKVVNINQILRLWTPFVFDWWFINIAIVQ